MVLLILRDYTEDAVKAISTAYRTGQSFGATHCISVLMGTTIYNVLLFNL
jgi:superfamily II DNA helicase RecQ